jgi:hypothetical protein
VEEERSGKGGKQEMAGTKGKKASPEKGLLITA